MNIADVKPPISERTAAHGRNVMVVSCLALALGWVPGINLEDLTVFGLQFENEPTAQISAWAILAVVLVYYCLRFNLDFTSDFTAWAAMTEVDKRKKRAKTANYQNVPRRHLEQPLDAFVIKLNNRFWRYDVSLPLFLAIAAILTISFKLLDILYLSRS